ncbi:MAG TPA: nucleotidyltransferase domain-containing protein [Spirochaetota bacterium]|nr:nucleotidyltransferase domain-containing protein [Spirochaetota bacterium]HPC40162.1 nucleotidyltransferase domain-containing protein [Spirochaetota bacterium]HPL16455.1 nucleotidyltransferase domain-containing protein [Spirochaetota bacterium]HQF08566.1 nucleotidyltransferase domain-containing protein [Spirochaetota bacterium]HQH97197.1 nucleotidyltransferase domain-containing protein [Spirochaetota bacterium]
MNKYETSIRELAEQYKVFCFYSFGSRSREVLALVKGERQSLERSASDIDIGVHYQDNFHPSLGESIRLEQKLEDLFETRVDLVDVVSARLYLALEIIRGELLFCSNEDLQSEYELLILRRADDLAGYERERRKMILDGTIK